jgi:hypothetical protein
MLVLVCLPLGVTDYLVYPDLGGYKITYMLLFN